MRRKTRHTVTALLFAALFFMPPDAVHAAGAGDEKQEAGKESAGSDAGEGSQSALLEELEEMMAGLSTVSAGFVQEKEFAVLDRTMTIKGRMALKAPDKIAWHVDEPVRYRMIIRGSELQQWDEDTGRVQKLDLDRNPAYRAMFQQLTSWFSGRYESLLDQYELAFDSIDPPVLVFTPLPDTMFEDILSSVTISFREDARYIERLEIRETNDSLSVVRFHDVSLDGEIDERMWEPEPGR